VLSASSDLTATAETLSREVDKFFHNLRGEPLEAQRQTGTGGRG
jgi:methyl-accepting chemotaxis protein